MPESVIIDGVSYVPESEQIDPEYIESLEAENAFLKDRVEELEAAISDEIESKGLESRQLLELISNISTPPSGTPPTDTLYVDPISIQKAVDAAPPGATIKLPPGIYHQQINLSGKKNIAIIGDGYVEINGLSPAFWDWTDLGNGVYEATYPGIPALWTHGEQRSEINKEKAYPVLCTIRDEPLMWSGGPNLERGEFHITSEPNQQGTISVWLKEGQSIEDFRISPFDRLLWGDDECEAITIENVYFEGCSNTNFTGALSFPGEGWKVKDVEVSLVNCIGIELGQGGDRSNMRGQVSDSHFENVSVQDAGGLGWWGSARNCSFIDCGHIGSNWKFFDILWHASHKLENTHDCIFTRWYSLGCFGPGFWYDGVYIEGQGGGNTNNVHYDMVIRDCVRSGLELELGTSDNKFYNLTVDGIRNNKEVMTNPAWNQSAAVVVKRGSHRNLIEIATLDNAEKGVWTDTADTSGGGSPDNNVFRAVRSNSISDTNLFFWWDKQLNNKVE